MEEMKTLIAIPKVKEKELTINVEYVVHELVQCKDCKYFKKEDYWVDMGHGAKMLAGGDMPTCKKWGDGTCYTTEDGYCYLAEGR